jgi:hypothetical protein
LSAQFGFTLVGDGIANPANALTMMHAAEMFGANCRFRDTKGLAQSIPSEALGNSYFDTLQSSEVPALHPQVIAFDNLPGAREVYGFRAGREFTVMVGNERRGLSHEMASIATDRVHVPMGSRRIDCLNVAAASAVALYFLCGPTVGAMAIRKDPGRRRPELLLLGPGDHFELGSTIRSAAGLGWERAFIEDRQKVWFNCDRAVRAQGRAAARRAKNEILLVPCPSAAEYHYPRVTVITTNGMGLPLRRHNFTGGPSQLVVIPDESRVTSSAENWSPYGRQVEFAHLELPRREFTYHYRLIATIALAEISRQVGRRSAGKVPIAPRPPIYDRSFEHLAESTGQAISFDDLLAY